VPAPRTAKLNLVPTGKSRATSIAALIIGCYFLYFAAGAVHAHFNVDDPTNLGRYYERGAPRVLFDMIAFWSDAYRPTGGLFYLLIYYPFGLNPLPYRIVLLAVIAANVYLTWRIAWKITGSEAAAALAAMLACAHASQLPIYYYTSFVYDVLAYFFIALMLVLHIERRSQVAVILVYLLAIDSKEIAIVGAAWVLAYEVFVAGPRRWLTPAVLTIFAGLFAAGKMFAPGAVGRVRGYEMQFTLHRFVVNNCIYLNDLFRSSFFHPGIRLEVAWVLLTIVCAMVRRRELWWGWFIVSTAALPVAFTVVSREGGSLYLPLLAWSLFASISFAVVCEMALARFRLPTQTRQWLAVGVIATVVAIQTIRIWNRERQVYLDDQNKTWNVITQVRGLRPRPTAGQHVIFLANPFADWDTYFISRLLWRDRSIDIQLANKMDKPPTQVDLIPFDWILTFENGNLRVLHTP
jgi:hypothetical protein